MIRILKSRLFTFILGLVIASSISGIVYALNATSVDYKNNKNVSEAIDDLYNMASTYKNLSIPTTVSANNLLDGETAYDNLGNLITGSLSLDNSNTLRLINGTNTINVEEGKKYIIVLTITSYNNAEQNFKPSIVSGCTINTTVGQIGATFDVLASYANAYVVTATSNKITIQGNTLDYRWNFISYYEIG